jgi:hypothetical protein
MKSPIGPSSTGALTLDIITTRVLPFGMTNSKTVSVKVPAKLLREIPPPGQGRSSFILQAIAEKIARRKPVPWEPTTARGKRMAALLRRGGSDRLPLLSETEIEQELAARRGRIF